MLDLKVSNFIRQTVQGRSYVWYVISDDGKYLTHRRFSEFRTLALACDELISVDWSSFPSRTIFAASSRVIRERCPALNDFLRRLLQDVQASDSPEAEKLLCEFLAVENLLGKSSFHRSSRQTRRLRRNTTSLKEWKAHTPYI